MNIRITKDEWSVATKALKTNKRPPHNKNQIALEFTIGLLHTKSVDRVAVLEAAKSTTVSSGLGPKNHFGKKKQQRTSWANCR